MKKQKKNINDTIAALDIGSSKVSCVIAHLDPQGRPKVVGVGQQISQGLKGGSIVDMDALQQSILKAVHTAEEMAKETIKSVVVNIPGVHLQSRQVKASMNISGHAVDTSDIQKVLQQAQHEGEKQGLEVIHALPVSFAIDGNAEIQDPRGLFGNKLDVSVHTITSSVGPVKNIATCVGKCHLDIAGMVASPLASAISTLVEDEKDLGCTLIDMGGGTTSISVYANGNLIHTDTVPVGGMHVTNDIAQCLSTPILHAERLKTLYGSVSLTPLSDAETIVVPQIGDELSSQATQVPRSHLCEIIQPRIEETFEIIKSRLDKNPLTKRAGGRLVLTGGASQLTGVRDIASSILGKQVRIGRPLHVNGLDEAYATPSFATCIGLLDFATRENKELKKSDKIKKNLLGRVGLWLRENL